MTASDIPHPAASYPDMDSPLLAHSTLAHPWTGVGPGGSSSHRWQDQLDTFHKNSRKLFFQILFQRRFNKALYNITRLDFLVKRQQMVVENGMRKFRRQKLRRGKFRRISKSRKFVVLIRINSVHEIIPFKLFNYYDDEIFGNRRKYVEKKTWR